MLPDEAQRRKRARRQARQLFGLVHLPPLSGHVRRALRAMEKQYHRVLPYSPAELGF